MKQSKEFNNIIKVLKDLNEKYPNQGIGRHLSDATAEYKNLWGVSDKELSFALTKYQEELNLNIASQADVDKIIADAKDLGTLVAEDEDFYEEDEF